MDDDCWSLWLTILKVKISFYTSHIGRKMMTCQVSTRVFQLSRGGGYKLGACWRQARVGKEKRVPDRTSRGERLSASVAMTEYSDDNASILQGYRVPDPKILEIVDQRREPIYSFSPDRKQVLEIERPTAHPSIIDFTKPELKLAGVRIDPKGFCRSRLSHYTALAIAERTPNLSLPLSDDSKQPIRGIPQGYGIRNVSWSPNGKSIAFTIRKLNTELMEDAPPSELWVADVDTKEAKRVMEGLNSVFVQYSWIDSELLVAGTVPKDAGPPPESSMKTFGPRIEENEAGMKSQTRTYQDLLKSKHDEKLFEYFCTSSLKSFHLSSGRTTDFGDASRVYTGVSPSPSGEFVLVTWIEQPWSYAVPCGRFPKVSQIWTKNGELVHEIARLPLALDIPLAFDSCREGPRNISWRDDRPHEVIWAVCQDGGDPNVHASPRDIIYSLDASKAGKEEPSELATTSMRFGGIAFGSDSLALLYESEWKSRRSKTWLFSPTKLFKPELIFDLNYEDSYNDPGSPILRRTGLGTYVIAEIEKSNQIMLQGNGASPDGSKPFLDLFDLKTKEKRRIWQSTPPYFEVMSTILSDQEEGILKLDGLQMLARRETENSPPQFSIASFDSTGSIAEDRQISNFPHPYPSLVGMKKKILQYEREDGVKLNGTFYLPPDYEEGSNEKLPCILWAYPREFKSKDTAGQLRKSPHQFITIGSTSPLMMLSLGYAVLDGPSFPIFAEGDEEPNDTYVEQLTSSARAAVKELNKLGCIDISRLAVGGHSYGAFMAAGLLAHEPDLFKCGIARSGAYNRTMTPFGFQAEERTLWEALDTYNIMSPFMNADKITKPLLLIHGEADNNPGTLTIQSERMFSALKGHGVSTRLVILPYESHSYIARESILHCLAEMQEWLDLHCR